jgi:hypothetical protein
MLDPYNPPARSRYTIEASRRMAMPEDPKSTTNEPVEPNPPEPPKSKEEQEQDAGDFITRHVLEKDSVFFEG